MNKIIKILAIICIVSCLACLVACDQVDETDPTALKPFAAPNPNNPYDEKIPKDDISGNRDNFFDNTLTLLFTNTESLNNLFHDFVLEDFPGLDIKAVREVLVGEVERIRQQVLLGDKYKGSKVPSVETYNRWIEIEFNFNDYDKLAEAQELLYPRSEFRGVSPRSKGGSWFETPNDTNYSSQQQNIADLIDLEEAVELLKEMHSFPTPLRAMTVGAIRLDDKCVKQLCLIDDGEREEKLEDSVDKIRGKYGYDAITRGVVLANNLTGNLHEEDGFEPFKR